MGKCLRVGRAQGRPSSLRGAPILIEVQRGCGLQQPEWSTFPFSTCGHLRAPRGSAEGDVRQWSVESWEGGLAVHGSGPKVPIQVLEMAQDCWSQRPGVGGVFYLPVLLVEHRGTPHLKSLSHRGY